MNARRRAVVLKAAFKEIAGSLFRYPPQGVNLGRRDNVRCSHVTDWLCRSRDVR